MLHKIARNSGRGTLVVVVVVAVIIVIVLVVIILITTFRSPVHFVMMCLLLEES